MYETNILYKIRPHKNLFKKNQFFMSIFIFARPIFILICIILIQTQTTNANPATTYAIRSQGAYSSIYQTNLYRPLHCKADQENPWGSLTITGAYNRSFNPQAIADNFFSPTNYANDCSGNRSNKCPRNQSKIAIAGSRVQDRPKHALLADYFMLPNDFQSTIAFKPTIDSFVVNFDWHINLDRWIYGAYFNVLAPIVHTRAHLGMIESIQNSGINPQPEGIFTPAPLERNKLLPSFKAYAAGRLVQPAVQTVTDDHHFLTIFQQLKNAKISPCLQKQSGIAEIRPILGWNFIRNGYHVGFNVQAVAPAGTNVNNQFLCQATIGNGNHWEFGGAVNGHYDLWLSNNEDIMITLYGQALLTHLFTSTQSRTFDLKNSPFSRYMLAQQMDVAHSTPVDLAKPLKNNLLAAGKKPIAQFTNQFAPIANISTLKVDVSADIQADIVVALHVAYHRFHFDVGYNLWARSADSIKIRDTQTTNSDIWTLKGDAQVFGFAQNSTNPDADFPLLAGQPVALSATQSKATIYSGTNLPTTGAHDPETFDLGRENLRIDNPELATAGDNLTPLNTLSSQESPQIHTSLNPVFISYKKDLDCSNKNNKAGLTSSVFGHFKYMAPECSSANTCAILPHVGIGGQVEFAHTSNTLSQWHAWLSIGFAFR